MRAIVVAALIAMSASGVAGAQDIPPMPTTSTDGGGGACSWSWQEADGIGAWTETCTFQTGVWTVKHRPNLPGFVLTVDGEEVDTILQTFAKGPSQAVEAILPELRARGYIPDDGECVFEPAAIRPAPRTVAFFEIRPIGSRLAAFDATPQDEVPEPPCGQYGWSTHGVRYFVSDLRVPDRILYVNWGQDGMMFDPETVRFSSDPTFGLAGLWTVEAITPAPWLAPGETPPQPSLPVGSRIAFSPDRVEAPHPLGCANATYERVTLPPAGLFQGVLAGADGSETRAAEAAAALGLGPETPTVALTCDTGVFDFHLSGDGFLFALDNSIYRLIRGG